MVKKNISDMASWPSLTIEGNIISTAMVSEIDRQKATEQDPSAYDVRKGINLREEISMAFRVGQAHYDAFGSTDNPNASATTRFVSSFLEEVFGFDDIASAELPLALVAGNGRIPIAVVPRDDDLDKRSDYLSEERSRSAAFALQDHLNDRDEALWGLATNGAKLRLMRDNASLTRPAYIEANVQQIFENEDIASFAALWLLIHRSRFGNEGNPATDCALERWRDAGAKEGETARNRLAGQVEEALKALGSGFLTANPELQRKITNGEVPLTDWFNELLRLVYRIIFMMVAEDRNLLHDPKAKLDARRLYSEGYSLAHLRQQSIRRSAWDRYFDRYEGMKIVFKALENGEARLGLSALGGLFAATQLPELETAKISNKAFLNAIYRLGWLADGNSMVPVNWRAMETEELGSVYESLLELQPQLSDDGKELRFAQETSEKAGNQRKTTGSYYTPDSLVQALLDTALDPVLDKAESEAEDPAESLLNLSVIDPACGSGHFLLAAARRIASRVARIRGGGTAGQTEFRHALRDVARRCIHGVDRNPMAVELTKVALWIETVDPGLPLGFFDAQIRCGDALLGVFDLKALEEGIPDAAYKPLSGDDKNVAKFYLNANKDAKKGQGSFDFTGGRSSLPTASLSAEFSDLRDLPEETVAEIEAKKKAFRSLRKREAFVRARMGCSLFTAAFLLPKTGEVPRGDSERTVPTSEDVWLATGVGKVRKALIEKGSEASSQARAFHWPLEFPDVMESGGFDVVLGNPPWDILQHDGNLDTDLNDRLKGFFKSPPYNVFTGRRDLYKLFVCRLPDLVRPSGKASLLIPVGFLMEEDGKGLRERLWQTGSIERVVHFQNKKKAFFDRVHASYRFVIFEYGAQETNKHWFSPTIGEPTFQILDDAGVYLTGNELKQYKAEGAFGELHASEEYLKLHRRICSLEAFNRENRFDLVAEWHATTHKSFSVSSNSSGATPVGKNRDIHQFNDDYVSASFFVSKLDAEARGKEKSASLTKSGSRILIRDIARNDDTVTLIAALSKQKMSSYDTPAVRILGKEVGLFSEKQASFMLGFLNSRIADFLIRPFVDKHIKGYVLRRVPVPNWNGNQEVLGEIASCVEFLTELGRTAGGRPIWEKTEGRNCLKKLDSLVSEYLGLAKSDLDQIVSLFPHIYNHK